MCIEDTYNVHLLLELSPICCFGLVTLVVCMLLATFTKTASFVSLIVSKFVLDFIVFRRVQIFDSATQHQVLTLSIDII